MKTEDKDVIDFAGIKGEIHQILDTLRIPDDDKIYPLAWMSEFALVKVHDCLESDGLPSHWRRRKGAILPMWQKEAMFIKFSASRQC